jgi:hypothetical protein
MYRSFGVWQIAVVEDGRERLGAYPTPDWAESVARAEAVRLGVEVTGGSPPLASGGTASLDDGLPGR